MPIQVLPRKPSLAEALGAGFGKGLETGITKRLEQRGRLQQALALQRAKATQQMTQYQALSTKLRAEDQKRKIQTALSGAFLKLADPFMKTPDISADDVLPLSNMAYDIMEKENIVAPQAMQKAFQRYQIQRSGLTEANLPKFKASKAEIRKKEIINSLKERDINNVHLIDKELTAKKWPTKERKDIFKQLKGKAIIEKEPELEREEELEIPEEPPVIKEKPELEKLPPASEHPGKIIRETKTGKRYKSNGKKWTLIK